MAVGLVAQTFAFFRQMLSTAYGANAKTPASDAPGTTLDPMFGSLAILAVQQQQFLALPIDAASRLATSTGADVDSFVAPWGMKRAPGVFASGLVTFTLASPAPSGGVTIPLGLIVQTVGGLQYELVADASGNATNLFIAQGQQSIQGTVKGIVGGPSAEQGTLGNTPAGTITQLFAGVSGVPYVAGIANITNPNALTDGVDSEGDDALKARFTLRSMASPFATVSAMLATALGVQAGLIASIGDHKNQDGSYHGSFFTLIVNVKGSPTPPAPTLLAAVKAAVDPVRPVTGEFIVAAPTPIIPTVTGNVAVRAGYDPAAVEAAAASAVQAFINATGLDLFGGSTTLSYNAALVTMLAVAGVNPVGTTLAFNSTTADIVAPFGSQVVCLSPPSFTNS